MAFLSHMRVFFRRPVWLLPLLLTGCIIVEDFGDYWEKGFSDPCLHVIAEKNFFDQTLSARVEDVVRGVHLGEHTFLMIRETASDKGGSMFRYRVKNREYISYRLNENKREAFLSQHSDSGVVINSETATVLRLDAKSAALLAAIASEEDYWIETGREPYNPRNLPGCLSDKN